VAENGSIRLEDRTVPSNQGIFTEGRSNDVAQDRRTGFGRCLWSSKSNTSEKEVSWSVEQEVRNSASSCSSDPVSLTEKGRQTFVPLFRRHTALIKRAFQDVSPEELQQLEGVLKKIGKRAESLAEKKTSSQFG